MDRIYSVGGHVFAVSDGKWAEALKEEEGFMPFVAERPVKPEFVFAGGKPEERPRGGKVLYAFGHEEVDCSFGVTDESYWLELAPSGQEALCMWTRKGAREVFLCGNGSLRLLRFALWVGYGIMTAHADTVALHGSCIVYRQRAVLFLGESGTGKSTHTRLWREHIAGSRLLNDDSPVVVWSEDRMWVYGSPWSGKTPCYRAERYPLAACVRLSQASCNRIAALDVVRGFAALHPSAPPAFAYDEWLYDGICRLLDRLLSSVPVYHLSCLPDKAAAELACRTLYGNEWK